MSISDLKSLKLRVLAVALAAVAAFAIGAIAAADAGAAGSGGIGSTPGGAESGDPADTGESGDTASQNIKSRKYARIWDGISAKDKRWANRTAACESGRDPDAIGGGGRYRGAFQFMKATWRTSPKSPGGDPIAYDYRTQAVVAVMLKRRDGAGHWPVCG